MPDPDVPSRKDFVVPFGMTIRRAMMNFSFEKSGLRGALSNLEKI
jgi:hypothetical protein